MNTEPSTKSTASTNPTGGSRAWSRFLLEDPPRVSMHYAGVELTLPVCNESFGGIGILAPSEIGFRIDDLVTVDYDGAPMQGVVRFVQPCDDQQRVGIEWTTFSAK